MSTDYIGIDALRLQVRTLQARPGASPDVKAVTDLVATMCSMLVDQSAEHLAALNKQVLYLEHLHTVRMGTWATLEELVTEVRALREQLTERQATLEDGLKILAAYLPPEEER